jgi:hypothetical protein
MVKSILYQVYKGNVVSCSWNLVAFFFVLVETQQQRIKSGYYTSSIDDSKLVENREKERMELGDSTFEPGRGLGI